MTIKTILFALPIFAPDQMRLERNINSIQSVGQYLKENGADGFNISLILGGWAKTDELWNKIVEACHQHISPQLNPIRFDKNYGKAHVVNSLVGHSIQQNNQINAILTADSDILFPVETQHMFMRLAVAAEQSVATKKQNWGLIALNQLGQCCHWKVCYENQIKYITTVKNQQFPELVVWPTTPSGIAGGCLFLNREYWDKVGGYKKLGVYCGDDALMLGYCQPLGFSWQMVDTIGIVHPQENDEEYAKWKVRVCQRDTASGIKSDISAQVAEAEAFWKDRT